MGGLVGLWVDAVGTGRAPTSAKDIGADDEVFVGVDDLAGADRQIPPARIIRRIMLCDMRIA